MVPEKFSGLVIQAQRFRAAMQIGGQQLTEAPRAGEPLRQAQDMAGDVVNETTLLQVRLDIGPQLQLTSWRVCCGRSQP